MEDSAKKTEKNIDPAAGKSDPAERNRFQEILAYLETTDLEFVQIEKNGTKVSLRRGGVLPSSASSEAPGVSEEAAAPTVFTIRSPIVGRFRSSMGADRPSLMIEGGKVTAGQRVAVVEAMNIKKEVFSAVTGRVSRILVRDNDPVEYGQELFIVDLDPESSEKTGS